MIGALREPDLGDGLQRAGDAFWPRLWRTGALAGDSAEEAFRVRCDDSLNDLRRQDSGMVFIEIALALTRPEQFFTFQMGLDISGF